LPTTSTSTSSSTDKGLDSTEKKSSRPPSRDQKDKKNKKESLDETNGASRDSPTERRFVSTLVINFDAAKVLFEKYVQHGRLFCS
jgi:hypothetical protein